MVAADPLGKTGPNRSHGSILLHPYETPIISRRWNAGSGGDFWGVQKIRKKNGGFAAAGKKFSPVRQAPSLSGSAGLPEMVREGYIIYIG
jgi:hypothetical protein